MLSKASFRWLILSGLGLTAIAILIFLFLPRALEIDAVVVTRGPIMETVADQGIARVRNAYIVSAPVAGRLERIELEVGDRVVAGKTVAARLRPSAAAFLDPRARAQAEAAISAARAALAAAESDQTRLTVEAGRVDSDLTRALELIKGGVVSQQTVDNARAAASAAHEVVRTAQAIVRARLADVAAAQSVMTGPSAPALQDIAVISPASGVVTRVPQQSERAIAAGSPLVEIGDTAGLEAQIEFLSQDAVKIQPGQQAEIYNWGGSCVIPAEVRRVEPQGFTKVSALGVEEQRVLVMLQLTGSSADWAGLAPGYRVWGRVYLRQAPSVIKLPIGALVRNAGEWAAYRIEQGRARLRPLQVGAITDTEAEVLSGVSPGEFLVAFPSDQVHEGVRVTVRKSPF